MLKFRDLPPPSLTNQNVKKKVSLHVPQTVFSNRETHRSNLGKAKGDLMILNW